MDYLIILDTGPGETERIENALEFALSMTRRDDVAVRLFMLGDAVAAAKAGPASPSGQPAVAQTLRHLVMSGVELAVSDANLAARGIRDDQLIVGAVASPMSRLADWAVAADRVLTL